MNSVPLSKTEHAVKIHWKQSLLTWQVFLEPCWGIGHLLALWACPQELVVQWEKHDMVTSL